MTSPSITTEIDTREPIDAQPYMPFVVRGALLSVAAFLILIFSIAIYLDPYLRDESGKIVGARRSGTHTTMGLPPCTFKETTGLPCPSCGMTSSFALLIRGDLLNSVEANFAGTMLGAVCLLAIPWALASVWKQRLLFVRSFEMVFMIGLATFMSIMLLRWIVVIGVKYFFGRDLIM
jgi:hypothetical protein